MYYNCTHALLILIVLKHKKSKDDNTTEEASSVAIARGTQTNQQRDPESIATGTAEQEVLRY